jgi:hypothetical protein
LKPHSLISTLAQLTRPALFGMALLALTLLFCVSCRTQPLPPADLSSPGWRLRQGQAVWRPTQSRPELAGDLLLAVNADGDYLVQFSKTPFTLASAQVKNGSWRIELGRHSWRGHGQPPSRFAWFQLPHVLAGSPALAPWHFTNSLDQTWRLENARTGEFLEGQFFP